MFVCQQSLKCLQKKKTRSRRVYLGSPSTEAAIKTCNSGLTIYEHVQFRHVSYVYRKFLRWLQALLQEKHNPGQVSSLRFHSFWEGKGIGNLLKTGPSFLRQHLAENGIRSPRRYYRPWQRQATDWSLSTSLLSPALPLPSGSLPHAANME